MPSHYGKKDMPEEGIPPEKKAATSSRKMTDKQKADLKKHMDKLDMSVSEKRSHRMKMMQQMRKGKSVKAAHKAIMA
jgi:hypothetical protein